MKKTLAYLFIVLLVLLKLLVSSIEALYRDKGVAHNQLAPQTQDAPVTMTDSY